MRRRDFVVTLAAGALGGCARLRPATTGIVAELETRLGKLLNESNVPGASVALVQEGQLVWSREFGVRNSKTRELVRPDTLFEAASVSKTVFAYAALKLCERGVIGLDTPLSRYSARPFDADPRIYKVTVRHLLSHASGFAEWRSGDKPLFRAEPGGAFEYSGEGYFYLQSVITELTGRVDSTQCASYEGDFQVCATDFDRFMEGNLLRPFGMRRSGYTIDESARNQIAEPHDAKGHLIPKAPPRGSDIARYAAVGGLLTTAREYARFLIEVVAPKRADAFRLGETMWREMLRPQAKLPKGGEIDGCTAWALGWGVQERPAGNLLVHSGGQSGFRSLALASIERKSAFLILTNSDNGGIVINHPKTLELIDALLMPSST